MTRGKKGAQSAARRAAVSEDVLREARELRREAAAQLAEQEVRHRAEMHALHLEHLANIEALADESPAIARAREEGKREGKEEAVITIADSLADARRFAKSRGGIHLAAADVAGDMIAESISGAVRRLGIEPGIARLAGVRVGYAQGVGRAAREEGRSARRRSLRRLAEEFSDNSMPVDVAVRVAAAGDALGQLPVAEGDLDWSLALEKAREPSNG